MPRSDVGNRMGHEFIGVVESIGADVRTVKKGDLVVAPFAWSDGTCEFCQQGLQTSCLHGGWWGGATLDGGQGEAVRIPLADGTLVALPVGPDHALMPSLLTLSDVMGTGHHAALRANVRAGTVAAVVGDGRDGDDGPRQPATRRFEAIAPPREFPAMSTGASMPISWRDCASPSTRLPIVGLVPVGSGGVVPSSVLALRRDRPAVPPR